MEDYDALADAIKPSDITSNRCNATILRRLKRDDEDLFTLWLCGTGNDEWDYVPEDARGMGWLGYYLGKNTEVEKLCFYQLEAFSDIMEPFFRGLQGNKSIRQLLFTESDLRECDAFGLVTPFLGNNPDLTSFEVDNCALDSQRCRSLSLALRKIRSLKHFIINNCDEEGPLTEIIIDLSMHAQLETLQLRSNGIGWDCCVALSSLLRLKATGLRFLDLSLNEIDDKGVEVLTTAIAIGGSCLRELYLCNNRAITIQGWRAVSALLESPTSQLQTLDVSRNGTNDQVAALFANALKRNRTLEVLGISSGWESVFSTVLCDTSSINATFMSNHVLRSMYSRTIEVSPEKILLQTLLDLNSSNNKRRVVFVKILTHHDDFDMRPLFEWDFKVLPYVIRWLTRATGCSDDWDGTRIGMRKLSAVYQYVRGMPLLCVESLLRGELEMLKLELQALAQRQIEIAERKRAIMVRISR